MINIKEELKRIAQETESELKKEVIEDILDQGEESEDIISYMKDVLNHGCVSGTVSSLIYYTDTQKFFDKYQSEIFDLYNNYRTETGATPDFELNSNNLAWFSYEQTIYNLLNELEIEY